MKTPEELKKYKAAWYKQNKLKNPEEKKIFDIENRKYRNKSGVYKISWTNCKYYYYGQSVKLAQRFIAHLSELSKQIHCNMKLQSVFNKYGKPIFTVIKCCSNYELDSFELELIKSATGDKFNCNVRIESITNKGIKLSDATLHQCRQKRIISGISKLIYAYNSKTGELLFDGYGPSEISRKFGYTNCSGVISSILSGNGKTYKGLYFSLIKKSNQEVLESVLPDNQKSEYKLNRSNAMCGSKNPMYGIKRPENSGEKNAFKKLVASGYLDHKKPKKVKIEIDKILRLFKNGKTAKQIALIAGCGSVNINLLLRQNGIYQGKGIHRKNKNIKILERL